MLPRFVIAIWTYAYYTVWWRLWKWVLTRLTGKCELLRISYNTPEGASRTFQTENSLKHSKFQALKHLLSAENINIDTAVNNIMTIKSIRPDAHPHFENTLRNCLCQICGYQQLKREVENLRKVQYSSDNIDHEQKLLQLWQVLRPDEKLISRISKQWTEVGFQGDDPMTDFRGMGMLGLENLLYFATRHTEASRRLVTRALHPQYGYSFAIVGINITSMAYELLSRGHLKTHFYNAILGKPRLEHFHQVYSYLLYEFDKFWFAEKPKDIMEFNRVREKYQQMIIQKLKDKSVTLHCNFSDD